MLRAHLATVMCFVAVRHGSMQTRNAADGPWSGWVRDDAALWVGGWADRVSPAGDIPNGDVSDGDFTLQEAWLRVDAPNGETARFGGTANFRVYTNLPSDRYTIEISYNNGQNWQQLVESAPGGSTFVVPRTTQTINGFARVRATSHTTADAQGTRVPACRVLICRS